MTQSSKTLTLENNALHLEFDSGSGALIKLRTPDHAWEILKRAELGRSFELLVPLPDRRNNKVFGHQQTLGSLEVAKDGRSAVFTWPRVSSEHGGLLEIAVVLRVSLSERQARFAIEIENRSPYTVEAVHCPDLGEVAPPPSAEWFRFLRLNYYGSLELPLWPEYRHTHGYYGTDTPVQLDSTHPIAPFVLLRSAERGLYVGVGENSPELVGWYTELHPGYGDSMHFRVPEHATISKHDVAIRFAAIHTPYILPGEIRALTPVVIEPFVGDWSNGADIYRAWRNSWMKPASAPSWVQSPHSWLQLHINSPEDELRLPFKDLVRVGEECARHGVEVVQLVGWNAGGQDRGNPSHDADPRLGGFDALKAAIAQVQALGVKVVLFTKFTWADRSTERFREELIHQAIKDPYGDYYVYNGYQYQTAPQLLNINTRRLIPMCFLSEDYLRICEAEFLKVLALGADGMLFDECFHHSPALLCFDHQHGHRHGAPVYANDRELIRRFNTLLKGKDQFLHAGEALYDWEFEEYHLSYFRTENPQHTPLGRYLLPHAQMMTAITGFDDRQMVNQCLLYRYIISFEPFNFKGQLEDYPLTLEYAKQMNNLRGELREFVWDAEFCHHRGANVTIGGAAHHPYAVFTSKTEQRTVVIANDSNESITVQIALEHGQLGEYRLVDDATWRPAADSVVIPAASAAVVFERRG